MTKTNRALFRTRGTLLFLAIAGLAAPETGRLHAQPDARTAAHAGWFGDGRNMIAVVRPLSFTWYVTTSSGACPTGFSFDFNSDATPLCHAQFGLYGDVALPDYHSQSRFLEPGIWRPSDRRLYFQPAGGQCPSGSANLGRLASGAVYCSMGTVVSPGMTPLAARRATTTSLVGAWDPIRQNWIFPSTGGRCLVGTTPASGRCVLKWGHTSITPRLLDFDGDRNDDIGYFDPRGGAHHFIPSGRVCPKGSERSGNVNGTVSCRLAPSRGQVSVTPGDYDGDRIPDVVNYDVTRHRFSLVPTAKACPLNFIAVGNDSSGRPTCIIDLGAGADVPAESGDYDGDGRIDPTVVNETTYIWTIVPSSGNCPVPTTPVVLQDRLACQRQFGLPGDLQVP